MMPLSSLFGLALIPSLPALQTIESIAPSTSPSTSVPAVRIAAEDVPWDEVADWFLRTFGENELGGFIRRIAVHGEAAREGCVPSSSAVEAEVERLISERIQGAFQGDRELWRTELVSLGDTEEARRAAMLDTAAFTLEMRALIRGGRDSEEASLRALFEDRYGPGGVSLVLDAIILEVAYPVRGPSQSREEQRTARARAEDEVRKRLVFFSEEIEAGRATFAELVDKFSEDEASRKRKGRLEGFDPRVLSAEAAVALNSAPLAEVSSPILYGGRWYLFRVADRVQADFEKERPKLVQALRDGVVSAPESADWVAALLGRTQVQMLAQEANPSLDAPILKLHGVTFTGRDLAASMLLHEGGALVSNFVSARLIASEAESAGVQIEDAAVRARVQDDITLQAKTEAKGDLAAWEAMLYQRSGMTRAAYERQAMKRARTDLQAEALMASQRAVTEEEVRELWLERFGPEGRRHEVRLLSVAVAAADASQTEEQRKASLPERQKAALDQANELRSRALAGEDFPALCAKFSADGPSAKNGGRLEGYLHQQNWPASIVSSVLSLRAGSFSEPIDFDGVGYLLFEVVRAETTPLEKVEADLRSELLSSRPSAVRTAGWINSRLRATTWSRLPDFWRESQKQFEGALQRTRSAATSSGK